MARIYCYANKMKDGTWKVEIDSKELNFYASKIVETETQAIEELDKAQAILEEGGGVVSNIEKPFKCWEDDLN